jgi:2-keto-4-pentenoate hydratase/2-oxohepta-3-ene-1,7-dioic acid hydratase in catechol pathway
MRIASFSLDGQTQRRVGIVHDLGDAGSLRPDSRIVLSDITSTRKNLESPLDVIKAVDQGLVRDVERAIRRAPTREIEFRQLHAPVQHPGKFLAIGFNYRAHAEEVRTEIAEHPLFFNKQVTCVSGPSSPIPLPAGCTMLDYEGELAFVVSRRCSNVSSGRAGDVIGAWMVCNDVSARDWQRESRTVTMGKSHDGFGPIGPWLVTRDEVDDPAALRIETRVNGELRQSGSTSEMIFDLGAQLAYLSARCTLEPGDIITTGSPAGSAQGMDPPPWLKVGDVVRIDIPGVGAVQNEVIDERRRPGT